MKNNKTANSTDMVEIYIDGEFISVPKKVSKEIDSLHKDKLNYVRMMGRQSNVILSLLNKIETAHDVKPENTPLPEKGIVVKFTPKR